MKRSIARNLCRRRAARGGSRYPAAARTDVGFYVNVAPPVAPYEVVPAPRAGYAWVPGYWDWRYNRYHWVAGRWEHNRAGLRLRAGALGIGRPLLPPRWRAGTTRS